MTREECIEGMQRTIDEDRNRILVRIHVGYLIHAIRFLKEQMPNTTLLDVFGKNYEKIVRCGECAKREICFRRRTDNPDWFCADGERKITDAPD